MASREQIAQAKTAARLEDVCRQRGVALSVCSNERLEGCCPFHEDHTPSFNVYVESQRYCCFGCGAQGDVTDFVRALDGCSFAEALQRLLPMQSIARLQSARPSAPVRSVRRGEAIRSNVQKDDHDDFAPLLTQALAIYHETLLHTPPALAYLASRGIEMAALARCRLGYADGTSLRLALRGNEEAWSQAQRAGLLTRTGKEWLSGRLIIPDLRGECCTWMIGRALPTPIHPLCKASDKYLGLAIPKTLLGYEVALSELQESCIRPLQSILIVEGAIDYVLARAWELPCLCVAFLGTHASRSQRQALLHLHEVSGLPFIDWHDADERGRLASLPATSCGLNPLDVTLGRGRDKAVADLLHTLSHIWMSSWGPRMENAFEMALRTLYEANRVLVANDPQNGPQRASVRSTWPCRTTEIPFANAKLWRCSACA
jgi:DNA primase catalytic core